MDRLSLIPASYVLVLRDDTVLLHVRRGTDYMDGWWALPAGHVDHGESAREAATRELEEECGVVVAVDDLEPVTTMHRWLADGGEIEQRVDFFWLARFWSGEPEIREPDKNGGFGWFPLTDLPERLVPAERVVLDAVAAGRVPAILTLKG
ncbi:NUDIX hydrolase [Desertimonas flava]|jgi:ADP-ribose pyrophosphatase YjhB (NUDIX family)|uniref:NUDIX hydrolase n=1 Tax=Desertimonas flava TaxID=2064846 RepID=UPI000E34BC63|nr:NUDIX domain-containing protein [Desertimonas flava]